MAKERLDMIIFGATSFTGKYAVKEAERLSKEKYFTWGVADRCIENLKSVLNEFAPESKNIRIITAEVKNEESLRKMTEQTKVLVNCCGPYRFYGEPVVKACIATHTHQVDISGEPQYMEAIQLEYNKAAQEAGIYIVSACGLDCIPFDLGIIFTQDQFDGAINSIESYLDVWTTQANDNVLFHYDKWLSIVYNVAHINELRDIRAKLYPEKMPKFEPTLAYKGVVHWSDISESWARLLLSTNLLVGRRTQRFLYENYNQRPIQLQTYLTFKSWWQVLRATTVGATAYLITRSTYGRSLVLRYPKFFSGGKASHEGPTPEDMKNTHYSVIFHAKGWSKKLANPTSERKDTPDKEILTKVSGDNPEYGITNVAVLLSALMILRESDKIPDKGGVFTPGAAFGRTSMINELMKHGLQFEVVRAIS